LLAASFKTPRQALDCLLAGCESITLPLDVAQQFITSPAVDPHSLIHISEPTRLISVSFMTFSVLI
ncbi:hypothetical protein ACVGWZ_00220, partial [Enterobacter intestinihominis]